MDLFCDFVSDVGIPLVFGLNAGFAHGVRDEANDFAWLANSSDGILRYLTSPEAPCGAALQAVELGNEPNLYIATQRHLLTGDRLAKDFVSLRSRLDSMG